MIDEDTAEYSACLVDALLTRTVRQISENVATSELGHQINKVMRIIRENGTATRSDLLRRTQGMDRRTRDQIVADLVEQGRIAIETHKPEGAGRPAVIYRVL